MRLLLPFLLLTLAGSLLGQSSVHVVEENGARSQRLNMVFLSEGYTSSDMAAFAADVQAAVDYLFGQEPWSRYRSYFNIYRIEIASNQSGTDNGEGGGTRDTYFHSGFVTPGITQLLTINGTGTTRAYALLNTHVPEYHIPIMLVNDLQYGGSGGPIAVASKNEFAVQILEHELGHSFVKLTDEYDFDYPGYPAIEYPNATAKTVPSQISWNLWIKGTTPVPDTPEIEDHDWGPDPYNPIPYPYEFEVGHFEGANYRAAGWFRPHADSLMRSLARPVGQVNREAFVLTFYSKRSPVDSFTPLAKTQTITNKVPLSFGVTPKTPASGPALTVQWKVDGIDQPGATGNTFDTLSKTLGNGVHTVTAIVTDPTDWVRRDPKNLLKQEIVWTLTLSNQFAPDIDTPPADQVVEIGDSVNFEVAATDSGSLAYQWQLNGNNIANATGPTYAIPTATLAHGGVYSVKVIGSAGTATSSASLGVVDPSSRTYVVAAGKIATLVLNASGSLPPVTWTHNAAPVVNGARISGADTKTPVIKSVEAADAGDYSWAVGDSLVSAESFHLVVVTARPDYTGTPVELDDGIVGGTYRFQVPAPALEPTTPTTYAASGLPPGLKIDSKTGVIFGKPTAVSKDPLGYPVTLTLGNPFGTTKIPTRLRVLDLPPGVVGVFCGPVTRGSELGADTGGRIDLTVTKTGSCSGKLQIGATVYPFKSVLEVDVTGAELPGGIFMIKPKGGPAAGIAVAFSIDGPADSLSGGVFESLAPDSFRAWRQTVPVSAFQGYYTFGWNLDAADVNDADKPQGVSHGSFTVATTGKVTVAGLTADGEKMTCAGHVGPQGAVLVYQTLYTTAAKGSVQGVMDIQPGLEADGSDTSLLGDPSITWMRPPNPATRTYTAGFEPLNLTVSGGRYLPPAKTAIVMGLPEAAGNPPGNADLTFDKVLGNDPLAVDADITVQIKPGGAVVLPAKENNPKKTSLTVTPATGVFKGAYTTVDDNPLPAPATPRTISRVVKYQGIVVNDEGTLRGVGFFVRPALPSDNPPTTATTSPIDSGKVTLAPLE